MQAARGTSLSPDATDESPPGARRRVLLLLLAIAATAYALDVATKVLAVARLDQTSDVEVVGRWLTLTLVRNPGAAFSTGTEFTVVLTLISITVVLVVLWLLRRVASVGWAIGLGLLLAGVLGNLTDRMLRQPGPFEGHVIDFLRLPNWPVFNVADMCINAAAAVILVQAFRGIRLDGSREADHAAAEAEDDGTEEDGTGTDGTETYGTETDGTEHAARTEGRE